MQIYLLFILTIVISVVICSITTYVNIKCFSIKNRHKSKSKNKKETFSLKSDVDNKGITIETINVNKNMNIKDDIDLHDHNINNVKKITCDSIQASENIEGNIKNDKIIANDLESNELNIDTLNSDKLITNSLSSNSIVANNVSYNPTENEKRLENISNTKADSIICDKLMLSDISFNNIESDKLVKEIKTYIYRLLNNVPRVIVVGRNTKINSTDEYTSDNKRTSFCNVNLFEIKYKL